MSHNILGFQFGGTQSLIEHYDYLTLSENQAKIEGLVPKQISQFLLFDGELLNEFEQLVVDEKGSQASSIKKSIENNTKGSPLAWIKIVKLSWKRLFVQLDLLLWFHHN